MGYYVTVASYNYRKDFDRNDSIRYPNEYFGIKEDFGMNEKIGIVLHNNRDKFSEVTYQLLNSRGEIIDEKTIYDSWFIEVSYNISEEEAASLPQDKRSKINRLEPGEYRAVWYSNGKLVTMWDFGVIKD